MAETMKAEHQIDEGTLLDIYRRMFRIRLFEDRARDLYQAGQLPRRGHLYSGQEAVAAATLAAIPDDDYITSTHHRAQRRHARRDGRAGG